MNERIRAELAVMLRKKIKSDNKVHTNRFYLDMADAVLQHIAAHPDAIAYLFQVVRPNRGK